MNLLLNPYFQTDLRRSFFVFYYTAHRLVAANHRLVGANYRLAAANHCLVEANEGYAALAFALMRYWAAQTTCFSMLHRSVSLKISHRRLNSHVFLTLSMEQRGALWAVRLPKSLLFFANSSFSNLTFSRFVG